LELRRIGAAHNIHLPSIDGPPRSYGKEHESLMMEIDAIVGALKRMEVGSPEKYQEVRETAEEVLELWERFKKK